MKVTIYTTNACPKCKILKNELSKLKISFEERDMTTPESQTELITNDVYTLSAPVLQVDSKFYKTNEIFEGERVKITI
jgi:glutaredoxin-like protein NrdH